MNILFFLTPKSEVAYINEDDSLDVYKRQGKGAAFGGRPSVRWSL